MSTAPTNSKIDSLLQKFQRDNGITITVSSAVRFHVGNILTKLELIQNNPHSEAGFRKYTDDITKLKQLTKPEEITEIAFYSATKGPIRITSDLLRGTIMSVIENLVRETDVPDRKKGRNRNEAMRMCLTDIEALLGERVPIEFIAHLFGNTPETFRRQLSRLK